MERLTEKDQYSQDYKIQAKNLNSHCVAIDAKGYMTYYGQHIDKLAEYENLEEQGRLIKLPCKVGDTVYAIGFNNNKPIIYESVVLRILITEKEIVFNVKVDEFEINSQLKQSMFGKTVFLTQSEAEQKLKEMESD